VFRLFATDFYYLAADSQNDEADINDIAGKRNDKESEVSDDSDDQKEDKEEADNASNEEDSPPKYLPVSSAKVQELFQEGCTIQALHPQQYSDPMWRLNANLEQLFGCLVGANCYITPPNSQGLAPHHDDVEVFILQLQGSKNWLLYPPVDALARYFFCLFCLSTSMTFFAQKVL
jgi:hypothetical protein